MRRYLLQKDLKIKQVNQASKETKYIRNIILYQANLDYELQKDMLKNAIMRESMEGNLLQDRNEHGERDLKQSINLLTNCNIINPTEKANLCFCGSKRVLVSVHGPKGRKGG